MLHNKKQTWASTDDSLVEIYICGEADSVLFPALSEVVEMAEEIGEFEFEFTPYCG